MLDREKFSGRQMQGGKDEKGGDQENAAGKGEISSHFLKEQQPSDNWHGRHEIIKNQGG
ncbi:MAG TPA: hypothetical protein PLR47_10740 [Smithellaceae bacterium]|nr:hypothetical protein [Smithellaceae bacterium]